MTRTTKREWVYAHRAGLDLTAIAYLPDEPSGSALLLDIHGGAWSSGDKYAGRHYCEGIALSGTPVVAIDFRQGPDFQHPAAVEDIQLAIAHLRAEPPVPFSQLGLSGSSSGGHLALCAAINPTSQDEGVDFVIALWPVSNPLARYQYLVARLHEDPTTFRRFTPDRLKAGHEGYFGNTAQMSATAIQNQLTSGQYRNLPPLLLVQPELDQNVPVMMSQTLQGAWELAGGHVDYRLFPEVGHGFAQAEGPQTEGCIEEMTAFIQRQTPVPANTQSSDRA
ncbi:MAG: hypothetical protein CMQ05_07965 [Gammaproteobacteria bacterium]|nr:hypothetical protein [Gammaproteobacteria bacterium]RPG27569.1 MAG: alpha/beta hydrolase [Gammaproteobacteria bacterium TMED50]